MNHLLNIYVSKKISDQVLIGNYIGNWVKPSHYSNYPEEIQNGILMNRKIDEFIKKSPVFERSRKRLKPYFIKHSTLIINIFYDHFLALNWKQYTSVSLNISSQEAYSKLMENMPFITHKFKCIVPGLFTGGYINNLTTLAGVHYFMLYITKKDNFPTSLYATIEDLIQNYNLFKNDFEEFLLELNNYISKMHSEERAKHMFPVKYSYV
jgi:acyl carrier protein phosphodiesterase